MRERAMPGGATTKQLPRSTKPWLMAPSSSGCSPCSCSTAAAAEGSACAESPARPRLCAAAAVMAAGKKAAGSLQRIAQGRELKQEALLAATCSKVEIARDDYHDTRTWIRPQPARLHMHTSAGNHTIECSLAAPPKQLAQPQ